MKKKKKPEVRAGNHLKQDISMMCLLANENTNGSRKLLKELGKEDAINHDDLDELYKEAKDKRKVEKSFADIHPHKKFILKYCETKVEPAPADPTAEIPVPPPIIEQPKTIQNSLADVNENYHGCCGGMSGAAGSSCACGSSHFSGADGSTNQSNSNELMVIGMVSIVAILGLVMYMKK